MWMVLAAAQPMAAQPKPSFLKGIFETGWA